MQWLQFVNKLDCYKGKENKKQLLNIIKVLCSHNMVTLKDVRYLIKKNHYHHFDYVVYWLGVR